MEELLEVSSFRMMCFDAGGVRGALTASLLDSLEHRRPGLCGSAHLFGGSSTGALLAFGLAYGMKPKALVDFYLKYSEYIFTPVQPSRLRPKYSNRHLREVLGTLFPDDLRLCDLKRYVVVPVFRIRGVKGGAWGPVILNNFPGSRTARARVVDAAVATCAAPGLFPSYKGFIDGGVAAANPSVASLASALSNARSPRTISSIRLLSIGTGYVPKSIKANTEDWGEIQWAIYPKPPFPLVSVLYSAQMETDSLNSTQMLRQRFFRLNPRLAKPIAPDDYKKVPFLVRLGQNYKLLPALNWLSGEWFGQSRERVEI